MIQSHHKPLFCVIGNPVSHSLSPIIHQQFAAACGFELEYKKIKAPLNNFENTLQKFIADGGKGANVTVPFKQQAFTLVDNASDCATQSRAVNTIKVMPDGSLFGDNTDGIGLVNDLLFNLKWQIKDKRILIIGAGGAARGILLPLLKQQPQKITFVNRTLAKAAAIKNMFSLVEITSFAELKSQYDIIINATSASFAKEKLPLPAEVFTNQPRCYDLAYGDSATAFLHFATTSGAIATSDGLGMLVEQAKAAFILWHNVEPKNTQQIIKALRKN